ncbi:YebC/PmpR family DNA-binding transcriptional regulator [Ureaplasma urealyticum]|uniref:Probable transcriptional regulatory protein LH652_01450 n=1 Tax=Ureaplasma urealyticum TaxID=2130 RepID=A0ABD4SKI8_UREUR|nr:YebC/PmpR family DNA-binding transcriptional regulator [Ureaplasma urealyticum]MCF1348963.1 YebC/PmpR family DNA-binding transcriptional regulator [Ureaplasma urealyticum]
MPRKHLIASGINKKQQQQAKIWMKCAKEIKAATKMGGPNPEANPRLKVAIERALNNNLSRDSIERNINGASKDADNLKELTYEGYGPNGLAIIVRALTDNEQRTISAVRGYFSKLQGQIAKPNSVSMLFNEYGQLLIDKKTKTLDEWFELLVDQDIVDINENDEIIEILVQPKDFSATKLILENNNANIQSAEIKLIPTDFISLDDHARERLVRFVNACENDDDISWVITNYEEEL